MTYFDTSVLIPYYTPEPGSAQADALIQSATAPLLSDLAIAEFHVALSRKVKLGVMDAAAAARSRTLFEEHIEGGLYQRVALTSAHFASVRLLVERIPTLLRTLDAIHLAAAAGATAVLATFDKRLAESARHYGLTVVP